jgi:hypothetical protein
VIPEQFAWANLWAATLLWNAIALLAFSDSVRKLRRENERVRIARELGNGRLTAALGWRTIAAWFVAAFGLTVFVGFLAVADLIARFFVAEVALRPPPPDTSLTSAVLRYALVAAFFCFWRAKRAGLTLDRRIDELDEGALARKTEKMAAQQDEDLKLTREIRGEQERLKENLDEGER